MDPALVIWICISLGIFVFWSLLQIVQVASEKSLGKALAHWGKRVPHGLLFYALLWPVMVVYLVVDVARRWLRASKGKD